MTAKDIKKYNLIVSIGTKDPSDVTIPSMMGELASIDFGAALEMWEYMLTTHIDALTDVSTSMNLELNVFATLLSLSETKLKQLLPESPPLVKLIYGNSATSCMGANLSFLANQVLSSKIEVADEILRGVSVNKNNNIEYGERMRAVMEEVFNTYCQKNNVRVPSLNRKQTMLLLEYCLKIKGPTKNVLVQRIKELG